MSFDITPTCDRLTAATQEIDDILGKADEEKRPLSDEDRESIEKLEAECDGLQKQVDQYKLDMETKRRNTARQGRLSEPLPTIAPRPQVPDQETTSGKPSLDIRQLHCPHRLEAFRGENAKELAYKAGMFYLAVLGSPDSPMRAKGRDFCRIHGIDLLAQSAKANTAGGVLVFDEMETAIIDLREEYGVFRRETRVDPMASDAKVIPRRTGGLTAYFISENPTAGITESEKTWDNVKLVARDLAVLTRYSSQISEDAIISMADDLTREIAYAFASQEDDCGFLGDGTSTYGGITGLITACAAATATVYEALAGNTAFSTLDLVDFESMMGQLPQYAEGNAKWYISKAGWAASMLRLLDAAGGNTSAMLAGQAPMQFIGSDVVISQKMNSTLAAQTSTNGLVYYGDLRQAATLGDRRGIEIMVSDQRYFELNQIGIRGIERFDIVVHDVGDTDVAGSMIMLATPSS
jgi:HK97 family phage major capsid protein